MSTRFRAELLSTALVSLSIAGAAGAQPDSYVIHRAGLYGPEFTSSTGTRSVNASRLSASGLVAGRSQRLLGGATGRGYVAWVYEHGGTARVGYYDATHTSPTGDQTSSVVDVNALGTLAGISNRYAGTQTGATAWIYQNGALLRLGFTDAAYTGPSGIQGSAIRAINNAGQVVGHSTQYPGAGGSVLTPWLWDLGTYTILGLMDSAHTRGDGARNGFTQALSGAGDVAGQSYRYNGMTSVGTSAWLRRQGVTSRIGFFDAPFTAADGSQTSGVFGIAADGRAVGTSEEYPPGGPEGTATWISDGAVTARIGLFDGAHTGTTGQRLCYPLVVSPSGNVVGRAFRYVGPASNGESAWLYSGGVSVRVGLIGPGYQDTGGFEYSVARQVNDRGEVLGESTMITPQWSGGPAVWVYRAGQTRRVGLFDAQHTNPSSGFQSSMSVQLSARGDAIGTSSRYNAPFVNDDAWYYDRASDTVVALVFSVNTTTGVARSSASLLTDDGFVYGSYDHYNGSTFAGSFLYRWSMGGGLEELGPMVYGGIAGAGWQSIGTVYGAGVPGTIDHSSIVGLGRLTGETQSSVFVLTAGPVCGSADFDCDGSAGTDADIEAFFACVAGTCPSFPCRSTADFNDDGDVGTDGDIEAFFRVLAGGTC
jgi:hypothetical protein